MFERQRHITGIRAADEHFSNGVGEFQGYGLSVRESAGVVVELGETKDVLQHLADVSFTLTDFDFQRARDFLTGVGAERGQITLISKSCVCSPFFPSLFHRCTLRFHRVRRRSAHDNCLGTIKLRMSTHRISKQAGYASDRGGLPNRPADLWNPLKPRVDSTSFAFPFSRSHP